MYELPKVLDEVCYYVYVMIATMYLIGRHFFLVVVLMEVMAAEEGILFL